MEYVLTMVFATERGGKSTITINGVKPGITEVQANALMDTVISKNVFLTPTGPLVSKADAKMTERKVTKFTVA